MSADSGLATFAHYSSDAWRRSRVGRKDDLLEAFRAQRFKPQLVFSDAFADLRWRLFQEALDDDPFPWWVITSRALWAILDEAMRRTAMPLGPAPDKFAPRILEDVLLDSLSRMGGLRTLLDKGSCEYHSSSIEQKLLVLHWTAEAGLAPSRLLSDAMRALDAYARRTSENPASTAGFGAGDLVDALFRLGR